MKTGAEGGCSMEAVLEKSALRESERVAELERRVRALEERSRLAFAQGRSKEEELVSRYGEYVDKTVAARILGVSRVTVYAMLADGRILGACAGRRVDVRSIARYMTTSRPDGLARSGGTRGENQPTTEEYGHECA